ncbi:hypothetical protein ACOSQ2_026036 [Xanthoceras sorbifolium]
MDDWEDDHIPSLLAKEPLKNAWDDEDVDENNVKESWEEEEEPATAPAPVQPVGKVSKNVDTKPSEKLKIIAAVKEVPLDPVAQNPRQQRLVEEADDQSTTELFSKRSDEKTLDNFIPKSESDFLEYAELISHNLLPYEKSFHYMELLKAVMRVSLTALKSTDAKDVASSVMAIANEKLKLEKEANAGKRKTGTKKKQLLVDKPDDDIVVAAYDGIDDDDFM